MSEHIQESELPFTLDERWAAWAACPPEEREALVYMLLERVDAMGVAMRRHPHLHNLQQAAQTSIDTFTTALSLLGYETHPASPEGEAQQKG